MSERTRNHEIFTQVNDAILLDFELFNRWERNFLTGTQSQMMDQYPLSEKQLVQLATILEKGEKRKKRRRKPRN
jgi:hypothetical protein